MRVPLGVDVEGIKTLVLRSEYVYTQHAEIERRAEGLTFIQVEEALLSGTILEEYADTGRGESCLRVGFAGNTPVHTVCRMARRQGGPDHGLRATPTEVHRPMDPRTASMSEVRCNACGSKDYVERRIEYLYSHDGNYLLVPNTPVEVCVDCGMIYYDAAVLKEIERRFFAIQEQREEADRYIEMPTKSYA